MKNQIVTPPPPLELFNRHPKTFIVVLLIIIAQIFLFSYIPHGQSPDEFAHVARASSLAHGNFILKAGKEKNEIAGDYINNGLIEYYNQISYIPTHYEKKFNQELKEKMRQIRFGDSYTYHNFINTALYFPISYLPQAIAVFCGEKLKMRVYSVITMARILNLLAIFSLILIAAKFWELPLLVGLVLLMPMCLFQMSTVSSDGLHFAMVVLIASLFLNLIHHFSKQKFLWLCALICIIATHRMNLAVLLLMPFYIAFQNKSKKQFFVSFLSVFFVVGWILFAMYSIPGTNKEIGMTEIAFYYLQHPFETMKCYFNTFKDNNLRDFYFKSFIGMLGWLDYSLENSFYKFTKILFLIFICGYILKYKFYKKLMSAHSFLIYSSVLSFFLTFALLLVQYTPFPCTNVIIGVQGRYFIFLFIIFAFGLCSQKSDENFYFKLGALIILIIYGFISIQMTQNVTLLRYWIP